MTITFEVPPEVIAFMRTMNPPSTIASLSDEAFAHLMVAGSLGVVLVRRGRLDLADKLRDANKVTPTGERVSAEFGAALHGGPAS